MVNNKHILLTYLLSLGWLLFPTTPMTRMLFYGTSQEPLPICIQIFMTIGAWAPAGIFARGSKLSLPLSLHSSPPLPTPSVLPYPLCHFFSAVKRIP